MTFSHQYQAVGDGHAGEAEEEESGPRPARRSRTIEPAGDCLQAADHTPGIWRDGSLPLGILRRILSAVGERRLLGYRPSLAFGSVFAVNPERRGRVHGSEAVTDRLCAVGSSHDKRGCFDAGPIQRSSAVRLGPSASSSRVSSRLAGRPLTPTLCLPPFEMNVNLSSRDLLDSYNQVLSGDPNAEWTILCVRKAVVRCGRRTSPELASRPSLAGHSLLTICPSLLICSTYKGGSMDLKVQADGAGGLEELKDEFMDGRSVRAQPPSLIPPCRLARTRSSSPSAHMGLISGLCYRLTESNMRSFESRMATLSSRSSCRS